jgi:hypothetical protein
MGTKLALSHLSMTSSDIWIANLKESARTIYWTQRRQRGLRSGGTGVKPFPFANLNVTRRDYRWRSSTNPSSVTP